MLRTTRPWRPGFYAQVFGAVERSELHLSLDLVHQLFHEDTINLLDAQAFLFEAKAISYSNIKCINGYNLVNEILSVMGGFILQLRLCFKKSSWASKISKPLKSKVPSL